MIRTKRFTALAVAASLALAACGGNETAEEPSEETTAPTAAPVTEGELAGLEGSIFVSGSSTVEPISIAAGDAFADLAPNVAVTVEGPGTGDGFAKFCNGETDISDASRPIKDSEAETCAANGVEFIELQVAVDGLSPITSVENTAMQCLSFVDLYALLGPDSTGKNNWSDATAEADRIAALDLGLGDVHTPYPDAPLTVTAPGEESGTFDSFVELVIEEVGDALEVEDANVRPDYTASPNDNVIIEGIASNPTSLGWVGFAFVEENLDVVKPLAIDGGDGCVEPTPDTIASGEFPIARGLYIYVSVPALDSNPALAPFVDFYMNTAITTLVGSGAGQVPYVPLNDAQVAASQSAWANRTTGKAPAAEESSAGAADYSALEGSIFVSGSSTVEPISIAAGDAFADLAPNVAVTVEGPGTGDGFAKFCNGETDISDASRPIKDSEAETCAANGVEFIELQVAVDGLSPITSVENTAMQCLSFVDLYALLGPDSTGKNNWSDATAEADRIAALDLGLGDVHTPYPDAPLTVTAPGEESGTFDSFVELVIEEVGDALEVEDANVRPDYTASPNDNVIIEGIASNPTSLGWVGFAFVEENLDVVKPLAIDGGDGCVEPTPDTIASGEFPIARGLYIYVSVPALDSNPALAPFVDFYMNTAITTLVGSGAGQVPYVPLNDAQVAASQSAWANRTTGKQV